MSPDDVLKACVTRLGDNALILGQRMVELVASYPELEEELANANFALDYLGQARLFYSYAAELEGQGRTEDDFAFQRDEHEFCNLLLLEQPNGHFGDGITRLVLFDHFYLLYLQQLASCTDTRLTEIAARAEKEIRYHLRHNSQWMLRLGDGTAESHERVQGSLDRLWVFTGELFLADPVDRQFAASFNGPDLERLQPKWRAAVSDLVSQATLSLPDDGWMASGGKAGQHSEHFGFLLAEMQSLPRNHPDAQW